MNDQKEVLHSNLRYTFDKYQRSFRLLFNYTRGGKDNESEYKNK